MAFQSAPDTAEAVIAAVASAKNIFNVLNFVKAGGYDQDAIDDLAAVVDAAVGDNYLPLLHTGIEYLSTTVRGLENDGDFESVNADNAGFGTASGAGLPNNVTGVITLRTGITGRSNRGRFYALPTSATNQSGLNTFSTGYMNALVDFLGDMGDAAAVAGWTLSILSRITGGAPRTTATTRPVTVIEVRNRTNDSQRGRLPEGH